jgi:hypothetical protein
VNQNVAYIPAPHTQRRIFRIPFCIYSFPHPKYYLASMAFSLITFRISLLTTICFRPNVKVEVENSGQANFKSPELNKSSGFTLTRKTNIIKFLKVGQSGMASNIIFSRAFQQKTYLQLSST